MRLEVLSLLLIAMLVPLPSAVHAQGSKPIVVCTTSVLASIVKDLAGDRVVVEVIAPPSICPAHYAVKPSDVEKLREASLILAHGFEPWLRDLVKVSGSRAPVVYVRGPWNTPTALRERYIEVAKALEKYLGLNVSARLEKCLRAIDETARWLKRFAEEHGFVGTPVIVMLWQRPFIAFLGFRIVGVYGPPEKVSLREFEQLVENGTKYHALLVVDNLQSGTALGKKLAEEIGAVEVALTNFPYTAPGLNNVTQVMKYDAQLLAQALSYARLRHSASLLAKLRSEVDELRTSLSLWMYGCIASIVVNAVLAACIAVLVKRLRQR